MQALLIDDSRTMRALMKHALARTGFEINEAENGREGLQLLHQLDQPALALVDWNMPEMDGLEFVRAVRADPLYDSLCLIMVTTESAEDKRQAAAQAGANGYVLKPFTAKAILEVIERVGPRITGEKNFLV